MTKKLVSFDDQAEPGEGLPAAVKAELNATYTNRASTVIKAFDYGVRADTGFPQNASLAAAFQAAKDRGNIPLVELPPGVITISGSFPLAGYSAGLIGSGGTNIQGQGAMGSVIKCINQTGAVLDFTGFNWPADMIGRVTFDGFTIQGDGTPDPAKAKRGIYCPRPTKVTEYPVNYNFQNITVRRCGGAGIEMYDTYFGTWQNVTLCDPVGVVENDVPYAKVVRGNGTVYINVGLRSQVYGDMATHPGDVGASGAFILDGGDLLNHIYTRGVMLGCWAENLHVTNGSTIVSSKTMSVSHRDWSFFDCFKVKDTTGTSFIRFPALPPSTEGLARHGGNIVSGIIEGQTAYHDTNPKSWIDYGVRDSQGGNYINGTKGWAGNNVCLDPGVDYTTVDLAGGERPSDMPGWVDNSGTTTNTLIDRAQGVYIYGGRGGQRRSYTRQSPPEGALAAPVGSECVTPNGGLGVTKWIKTLGGSTSSGWSPIHGDTGGRVVTADLMNGWTDGQQPLTIRRVGNTVSITGILTRGGGATGDQFYSVPLGFRASSVVWGTALRATTIPATVVGVTASGSTLRNLGGTFTGDVLLSMTWTTRDPWPSTLPGTPQW